MAVKSQIDQDSPRGLMHQPGQKDATDAPPKTYKRVAKSSNLHNPKLEAALLKLDRFAGMPARQRRMMMATLMQDVWTDAWHEGYATAESAYGSGRD